MGKLNWPMLSRERPKDVFEHASALKDDFKALHDHVKKLKANKRHLAKLPSGYTSKISKGISRGVTEAIDNEYYPKFISDIDKDLFCKTLLQTIRSELITEVHDRIPLLEFDTLHSSYKELVKKLPSHFALDLRNRDMTPNSDPEQNRGDGSQPPTSRILNQAAIPDTNTENGEMDIEIDEEAHDILRTLQFIEDQGSLLSHQLEFLDGYTEDPGVPDLAIGPGRNGMDESEEGLDAVQTGDRENAEEGEKEEEIRNTSLVKHGAYKVNAGDEPSYLQDDDAGTNAMRGFDIDKRTTETKENYEHPSKPETPNIQDVAAAVQNGLTTPAFSELVTFEIKHQATVNHLVLATSQEILDHLYRSLQKIVATRESVTDWVHLSEPRLVDDGGIMFRADTDSQDIFRPAPIDAWEAEFEAGMSPRVPTFKLAFTAPDIIGMNFATRKGKAKVIHELIDLNNHRLSSLHGDSDIIDIAWSPHLNRERPTSLLIEFSNIQLAEQILHQGLAWQGIIYKCHKIPMKFSLPRCGRCQNYGHLDGKCSAPYCCGTCAEAHSTKVCTSSNVRCALCGGPHQARSAICPVRIVELNKVRFPTRENPVKVRSDTSNASATGGRNLHPSTSNLVASPQYTSIDDEKHKLSRCGECQGYGSVAGKCSARPRCGRGVARPAVCNGDHIVSSAISPSWPLGKARAQQLQISETPYMSLLRPSTPDQYLQEPEIKTEPQSPSSGAAARPNRKPKQRSMLAQVEELIEVASKGDSREMAFIKDHLETLGSAMKAEGGDIVAATPRPGKRRAQEALMSGALQDRFGSPKRTKF